MEKVLFFCVFSCRVIQITSSEHDMTTLRFQLNEAISLDCNISNKYEISWYHQNPDSGRLTLLMTAKISSVAGRKLLVTYNLNKSRLKFTSNTGMATVSLVITELTESDSGIYFCGTKSVTSEMHFDKPIRLEIEGKLADREEKCDCVTETADVVEVADDGVTVTERVLMFGGVGLAVFVFFLATVIAGGIIHHHGWQKGWKAAKRTSLMRQKSAK